MNSCSRVLIVYKEDSPEIFEMLKEVKLWFEGRNILTEVKSQKELSSLATDKSKRDLVLVLGGDGTYLKAVQFVSDFSVPFLGINMGSLGFLTVHRREVLKECLAQILEGKMEVEKRSLLEISLVKNNRHVKKYQALNDMVMERGALSHLINIAIRIEGQDLYSVTADGLIVASPTGSTAYNLAAGGPILHPQVKSFVITPVCSHSLTQRPVIVPEKCRMSFYVQKQSAFLTIDGRSVSQVSQGHRVVVEKSQNQHLTFRSVDHNDFLLLKEKLKFSQ